MSQHNLAALRAIAKKNFRATGSPLLKLQGIRQGVAVLPSLSVDVNLSQENGFVFFLGHTGKGDLGSNRCFHLVGCVDGREFGFGDNGGCFPVNVNSVSANKNLINMNGDPVSPFFIGKDIGSFFGYWTKRNLSQIRQNKGIQPVATPIKGTSGGNALPISYETTLFPDLGFKPPIPGWRSLHSFPPNPNDPSIWMYTYLDAAILYAGQKHENKKEEKACS